MTVRTNTSSQKGMGLIMLILIGAALTAFALNRAMPDSMTPGFLAATAQAERVFAARAGGRGSEFARIRLHGRAESACLRRPGFSCNGVLLGGG